jgi:hypothetical protein
VFDCPNPVWQAVKIFESAGARSVATLLTMPRAKGPFHRAIVQRRTSLPPPQRNRSAGVPGGPLFRFNTKLFDPGVFAWLLGQHAIEAPTNTGTRVKL